MRGLVRWKRRRLVRQSAPSLLALVWMGVSAQAPNVAENDNRPFRVVPTLAFGLTATDNVNLTATDKRSDLIAQVSPGFQLSGQSARLKGFANYVLTGSFYARQEQSNTFYNNLNAALKAEVVDDRMFVDLDARISPQNISPFGTQSADPSLNNSNQTEVSTIGIAPYLTGQIGGELNYLARAFYTYTNSGTSQASDSAVWGGLLRFDSTTRWAKLGWSVDLSYREANFSEGRSTYDQLNLGSLTYELTPAVKVSLRGNVETSNLVTLERETTSGVGAGLRWDPSPRTKLLLEYDQRAFGSSHLYSLEYRTPRTLWVASSRRSLSVGQFNGGRGSAGSPFDMLFAQFATVEPDPVKREQLVTNFMQANGINADESLNSNFLPSQVQLEDRNDVSASLLGVRSTVVISFYQTKTQGVYAASSAGGSFAGNDEITWLGGGLTWSHRLTPLTIITLNGAYQRTTGTTSTDETTLWTGTATWSYQLAERTTLSATARRTVFSSTTSPYNESALLAALSMQF